MKETFAKVEMVILRVALILLTLIGVIKLIKVELSGLWN